VKKVWLLSFACLLLQTSWAQNQKTLWVDSVFQTLQPKDKVSQPAPTNPDENKDAK
jgi:hypothetical protein